MGGDLMAEVTKYGGYRVTYAGRNIWLMKVKLTRAQG